MRQKKFGHKIPVLADAGGWIVQEVRFFCTFTYTCTLSLQTRYQHKFTSVTPSYLVSRDRKHIYGSKASIISKIFLLSGCCYQLYNSRERGAKKFWSNRSEQDAISIQDTISIRIRTFQQFNLRCLQEKCYMWLRKGADSENYSQKRKFFNIADRKFSVTELKSSYYYEFHRNLLNH